MKAKASKMNDESNKLMVKPAYTGELSPWLQAAQEELGSAFFTGSLLRFVKGEFLLGQSKQLIGPKTLLLANLDEWYRGWNKWREGKVIDRRIGRVSDRFVVPAREELGDLDPAGWERDSRGEPGDPWARVVYLGMRNPSSAEPVVFTSASQGGSKAVAKLGRQFCLQSHRRPPNMMPLVALGSEPYLHPEYGKILSPVFTIVGWKPWDVETAKDIPDEEPPAGDNEEIPF
jgi:hypothetical protein